MDVGARKIVTTRFHWTGQILLGSMRDFSYIRNYFSHNCCAQDEGIHFPVCNSEIILSKVAMRLGNFRTAMLFNLFPSGREAATSVLLPLRIKAFIKHGAVISRGLASNCFHREAVSASAKYFHKNSRTDVPRTRRRGELA